MTGMHRIMTGATALMKLKEIRMDRSGQKEMGYSLMSVSLWTGDWGKGKFKKTT